jgi:hypothetical protein
MNLKELCVKNLVYEIDNMPPLLKEEVIGISISNLERNLEKKLESKIKRKVIDNFLVDAEVVIDDIIDKLLDNNNFWRRPAYTEDMDDDIYNIYVQICNRFVQKYQDILCSRS